MYVRQKFGGSTPPIYLTDVDPSNIGGGLDLQNIGRMWIRQPFGGSTPPKHLMDVWPSNIWGVYTSKIFDGCGPVKCLGGLHPRNI